MIIAVTVGILVAGGTYLLLSRSMVRAVFGIAVLSHAANFVLLAAGVPAWRAEPLSDQSDPALMGDPLPMAFVLTAIVITLAVTVVMLTFAVLGHNDDTHKTPAAGETHV